eukprot:1971042-Lingulodinium_polyedra.AAC.1
MMHEAPPWPLCHLDISASPWHYARLASRSAGTMVPPMPGGVDVVMALGVPGEPHSTLTFLAGL